MRYVEINKNVKTLTCKLIREVGSWRVNRFEEVTPI